MYIKNRTLYDKNLIIAYNRYYLNSFLKRNFLIVAVITLGFAIYMFASGNWKYGLFLLGVLAFYFALTYLMQLMTTRRVLKKSPLVENPVMQTYVFMENEVLIENLKSRTISYGEIVKVLETKNFLILSDQTRKTYIVDKSGFESQADCDTLKAFLKDKYGKAFRRS